MENPTKCYDCGAEPGQVHSLNCDVERCSVCGGQRLSCDCAGHDRCFARWTGWWPGSLECEAMGISLNDISKAGLDKALFIKPKELRND